MGSRRDDAVGGWEPGQSAYEGRTDNPASDTDAGKRGPAAGSGSGRPSDGASDEEARREGGGATEERE
jgi:hypothetical protein